MVLLLTSYWISDAIPYAVTSILPLVFFPMAGILPGDKVSLNYFKVGRLVSLTVTCVNICRFNLLKDISTMLVGSMTLAYAMEHVHLHRRLALSVLKYVGSSVTW